MPWTKVTTQNQGKDGNLGWGIFINNWLTPYGYTGGLSTWLPYYFFVLLDALLKN